MNKILLFSAVALMSVVGLAQAQPVPDVNCAALSGSPLMCVKNASAFPVVAVQAYTGNTYGNSWVNIPGGTINPGGTTVVKFDSWHGGCNQNIVIRTASGQTHSYPSIDVCRNTSFVIRGW